MKPPIWRWVLVGILGVLLLQSVAIAQTIQIILFDGPDFSGEQRTFSSGVRDLNNNGFNDRAESLIVASGTWTVCSDFGSRGSCQTFSPGSYASLGSFGLANAITSLQPETASSSSGSSSASPRITVYSELGFGGNSAQFTDSISDLIPRGLNDTISSVQIDGGTWKFCSDVGYRGNCQTLGPGSYNNLSSLGLQDSISSMQLVSGGSSSGSGSGSGSGGSGSGSSSPTGLITVYFDPNYGGTSASFSQSMADLIPRGLNDMISSVRIQSGTWKLCSDVGYRGHCRTLGPGSYSDLSGLGLQDTISSMQLVP